ncbi:hypothetical protein F4777DRAFT_577139 [Nemania sp. FL0916]|nr:hypothetical protein F4777DRAFT_577139 [Nemania sp. FL0916]
MAPAGEREDSSAGRGEGVGGGERRRMPTRNPMPLSASQEAQVREVFNAQVRELCAKDIQAFAACASGRTFTIPFTCRALARAMNGCMQQHATAAQHDRAREDWVAGRLARQRERERKERRREEQERFLREWWDLPDHLRGPGDRPGDHHQGNSSSSSSPSSSSQNSETKTR